MGLDLGPNLLTRRYLDTCCRCVPNLGTLALAMTMTLSLNPTPTPDSDPDDPDPDPDPDPDHYLTTTLTPTL